MVRRTAVFWLLALLVVVATRLFALPPVIAFIFIALSLWLYRRGQRAELGMVLASLLVGFGCIEVFVRLNADHLFFREQEKWELNGHYHANVRDSVPVPHGDLVAMDPSLRDAIAEPRQVEFLTDSDGYRNDHDYDGEPYVVLGDSFVASVSTTQAEALVGQLNARMPGTFFSRGFPGAPIDYVMNALAFLDETHADARFVWFVFEGNDFGLSNEPNAILPLPTGLRSYRQWWQARWSLGAMPFMGTHFLNVLFSRVGAGIKALRYGPQPSKVQLLTIADISVGFYEDYIKAATAGHLRLRVLDAPAVFRRTACVLFIPDKYRVYKPWIAGGPALPDPPPGIAALRDIFDARHIPVIDLTPTLRRAAEEELAQGRFVFWRDDTHWNPSGIASVLGDVERCIAEDRARLRQ